MLTRAVEAGVPAGWVAADEVYADPKLRVKIRELGLGYVLNIASNQHLPTPAGRMSAAQYAASAPASAWQRYPVGNGSKGPPYYDWLWRVINAEDADDRTLAYLAADDVHRAHVIGHCAPTIGIEPFTALAEKVMTTEPYASARRVFWVVDNGCSHRGWTAATRLHAAFPTRLRPN
jgi:hypothetical protein